MAKMKYYAIRNGRESNLIVTTWKDAEKLVKGFRNAEYKSFKNEVEAQKYLDEGKHEKAAKITHEKFKELYSGTIPDRETIIKIHCKANCEMQIAGRCTQHIVNINKDGQCENY